MNQQHSKRRKWLEIILIAAFVVAMLMGVGPGVLLVNRPDAILGMPLLYAWGILWYAVHVVIVLVAYRFLWRDSAAEPRAGEDDR
jgi:hypothetical protein